MRVHGGRHLSLSAHTCVCMCVCGGQHLSLSMQANLCVCVRVHASMCTCVHAFKHRSGTFVCACVCLRTCAPNSYFAHLVIMPNLLQPSCRSHSAQRFVMPKYLAQRFVMLELPQPPYQRYFMQRFVMPKLHDLLCPSHLRNHLLCQGFPGGWHSRSMHRMAACTAAI